jgi:hypothetical protein
MNRLRRLRALPIAIVALAAILLFAATAAAETRTGEASSPASDFYTPEGDILNATASYDTTGGSAVFNVTTAGPAQAKIGGKPSKLFLQTLLFAANSGCNFEALVSGGIPFPLLAITDKYALETAEGGLGGPGGGLGESGATAVPVVRSVAGTTTNLSVTSSALANQGFNCVLASVAREPALSKEELEEERKEQEAGTLPSGNFVIFPISAPPAPATAPAPPAPAPPAAPPAALSIFKSKPLKLKVGKWATAKVKVTNSGSTATAPGSLQLKAAKGVIVKPARQKLPVLLPGGSWTVSYKVKLTAKAKKTSTLSLVGAAGTLSARGSLVLKSLAG